MKRTHGYSLASVILIAAILAAFWVHARSIRKEQATAETLPNHIADWQQYDGIWQGDRGNFSDLKDGRGDKAVAGNPNLGDYDVSTDIRFDSDRNSEWGDAGIVLRVSNASIGTDSYDGYYIGLRLRDQALIFSRSEDEYFELATAKLPAAIQIGAWYQLRVHAQNCTFRVVVTKDSDEIAKINYDDGACRFKTGQVGARAYSVQSSWRNFQVQLLH